MNLILLPAMTMLMLTACSPESDSKAPRGEATSDAELTGLPDPLPAPTATPSIAARVIPVAMQGRWGLVPGDCTSTRGDAKGLLLVEPTGLKFYESMAQLGAVAERSNNKIRATYAFTGEGMDWSRDMALELGNDGNRLVRREFGAEAIAVPLSYTRCPAQGGS